MNVRCLSGVSLPPLTSAASEFTAGENELCFILSAHIRFFFPISFFIFMTQEVGELVVSS